jgi:tagatose-6-phosphate ketose/aldose isomerase
MLMTAQFLAQIKNLEEYGRTLGHLSEATSLLFENYSSLLKEVAETGFERAVFLGSGCLYGCAIESSLKLQEMTSGEVICRADTFLGVRHGPEVVINGKTLVVNLLSTDPHVRKYELDLMQEIESKKIGMTNIAVCNKIDEKIEECVNYAIEFDKKDKFCIPDFCRPIMDVTVGQLLGLFKSLTLGLKPDNPSEKGIIKRVVKGVKIYDYEVTKRKSDP